MEIFNTDETFIFKDAEKEGMTRYIWRNLIKLGYIVECDKGYKRGKALPDKAQVNLEIAKSNYEERFPNKIRNKGVTIEDMDVWLEILFNYDGLIPFTNVAKECGMKNSTILRQTLKDLGYITKTGKYGTEIGAIEYNLSEIYSQYCFNVKEHSRKYNKSKIKYNSIYEKNLQNIK